MKRVKYWHIVWAFLVFLGINACDEGASKPLCSLDCGHGKCVISTTGSNRCVCDIGYAQDLFGKCTDCDIGYNDVAGECVKDPCTNFCTGEHEVCSLVDNVARCDCAEAYERVGADCKFRDDCKVEFVFNNTGAIGFKVYVTGSFDNWSKTTHELQDQGGGKFKTTIALERGEYEYKFFIDGWNDAWQNDPERPIQGNDNNSVVRVGACGEEKDDPVVDEEAPQLKLIAPPIVSSGNVEFTVQYIDGKDGAGIDGEPTALLEEKSVNANFDASGLTLQVSDTGKNQGKYAYFIDAKSKNGKTAKLFVPVWVEAKPFDWRDGVLYFAFIDRFLNGDTSNDEPKTDATVEGTCDARWMGGDFAGLKQKVEDGYFESLGVNTLWISSVSMNGQTVGRGTDGKTYSAYHSYWPVATGWTYENESLFSSATSAGLPIRAIEPHFGTMEEFKALVGACHQRGMRVLVDFAANHVHEDSPLYKKHRDWFNTEPVHICNGDNGANWNKYPLTCWFAENLPDFNYEKAEVRKAMVDHAKWLIQESNIDGFRVDAVKHMTKQFVIDLRRGIDAMFENTGITFYMVGETFEFGADALKEYIGKDLLHGQFDFGFYGQIKDNILSPHGSYEKVKNFTEHNDHTYNDVNGIKAIMGTFIGNHDVARAISVANENGSENWGQNPDVNDWQPHLRLKLAWTVLLTSPGVPLFYYGDEFGLEGAGDPDNRRMMKFDGLREQQEITFNFVKQLGKIREENPVLSRGNRQNIAANNDAWIYKMVDDSASIWVGVSKSNNTGFDVQGPQNGWVDLLNNNADIGHTNRIQFTDGFQIFIWKEK
ncbi:MAG: alpha-amylase family glycosyl hydrolase [Bradymonadia bacterium]|jgi:glycosidase